MLRVFVRLLMNILCSTSFAPPTPRIIVVISMNVDIHFICLIMKLSCSKFCYFLLFALLTTLALRTNLFALFCVLPLCYVARLSHLNKAYLLAYLGALVAVW